MLVPRQYLNGESNQINQYHTIGPYRLSTTFKTKLSHTVFDDEGKAIRQFRTYLEAKEFISNKPGFTIKKIKFDFNKFTEQFGKPPF